jgi:hypothetical protein
MAQLRGTPAARTLPPLDEVLRDVGNWAAVLAGADLDAKRSVLQLLVTTVTPIRTGWGKYEVEIAWTPTGALLGEVARSL